MTVFNKISDYGFKISIEKSEFFLPKIKYLGQIIDKNGRKPDPARAEAMINMPAPDNVTKLQAFLGLVSYYSIYIPNVHDLRAPLNKLMKKCENGSGLKRAIEPSGKNAFYQILR